MLEVLKYGTMLFFLETVFLLISTITVDLDERKPNATDTITVFAKFYLLNIILMVVLQYFID